MEEKTLRKINKWGINIFISVILVVSVWKFVPMFSALMDLLMTLLDKAMLEGMSTTTMFVLIFASIYIWCKVVEIIIKLFDVIRKALHESVESNYEKRKI